LLAKWPMQCYILKQTIDSDTCMKIDQQKRNEQDDNKLTKAMVYILFSMNNWLTLTIYFN
jgi:hypothetical protein